MLKSLPIHIGRNHVIIGTHINRACANHHWDKPPACEHHNRHARGLLDLVLAHVLRSVFLLSWPLPGSLALSFGALRPYLGAHSGGFTDPALGALRGGGWAFLLLAWIASCWALPPMCLVFDGDVGRRCFAWFDPSPLLSCLILWQMAIR